MQGLQLGILKADISLLLLSLLPLFCKECFQMPHTSKTVKSPHLSVALTHVMCL